MEPIQNTIFGGHGFIGSHMCRCLEKDGLHYQVVGRQDSLPVGNLGNVYYCAGVTADFRSRPFDTISGHVSTLSNVLENGEYTSFIYLSSARIYRHAQVTTEEGSFLIDPCDPENLVDISKLAGEALCLSMNDKNIRIVRLSNVFGNDFFSKMFLTEIIGSALVKKEIYLRAALNSSKDFVDVESAVNVIRRISKNGKHRLYNIASGYNISHKEIAYKLRELTGCTLRVADDAPSIIWSLINIDRVKREFDFKSTCLTDKLGDLVCAFENQLHPK